MNMTVSRPRRQLPFERFLHRPIVDEYVEILWASMKALWPRWSGSSISINFS